MDSSGHHQVHGIDLNYSNEQTARDNNTFSISAVISTSCVILDGLRDIASSGTQGSTSISSGPICTSSFLSQFSPSVDMNCLHHKDVSSALQISDNHRYPSSNAYCAIPSFESAATEFVAMSNSDDQDNNSMDYRSSDHSLFPVNRRVWNRRFYGDNQHNTDTVGRGCVGRDEFTQRQKFSSLDVHGMKTLSEQNGDFQGHNYSPKISEGRHVASPCLFLPESSLFPCEVNSQKDLHAGKNKDNRTQEDTTYWRQTSQCEASWPSVSHTYDRSFDNLGGQDSVMSFLADQQNVETLPSSTISLYTNQNEMSASLKKDTTASSRSYMVNHDCGGLGQKNFLREDNTESFEIFSNRSLSFDNTAHGGTNKERSRRLHETNVQNVLRQDFERNKSSYSMGIDGIRSNERSYDEESKVKCSSESTDSASKAKCSMDIMEKMKCVVNKESSIRTGGGRKKDGDTVEGLQHQLEMLSEKRKKDTPACSTVNVMRHRMNAEERPVDEGPSSLVDVDHMICSGVTVAGFKPRAIIRKKGKTATPTNVKDTGYWQKRRKNNDSARKSRESKKEKEKNFYKRALELEYENFYLQECLTLAEAELAALGQQFIPPVFG